MTDRFGARPSDWATLASQNLGHDLLPVVSNLGATISPHSKLAGLGKTPSRYNRSGYATGISEWTKYQAVQSDLDEWSAQPDYGICLQTREVRAIDIDVPDRELASQIEARVQGLLEFVSGELPCRYRSNSGKRLLAVRSAGELSKRVIRLPGGAGIIELLGNGQQFIAFGQHDSGVPYTWRGPVEDIPLLPMSILEAVWFVLADEFGESEERVAPREGAGGGDPGDDPVAAYLLDNGLALEQDGDKIHVECPWKDQHSSDTTSSTSWLLAGTGGYRNGHFMCLHTSHGIKTEAEFLDAIGYTAHAQQQVVDEFDVVPPPRAVATLSAAAVATARWRELIARTEDPEYLQRDLCELVSADRDLEVMDRGALAQLTKDKLKTLGVKVSLTDLRKAMTPVRKRGEGVPDWADGWVFIGAKRTDAYRELATGLELSITGFDQRFSRMLPPDEDGRLPSAHLTVGRILPAVAGVMYLPGADLTFSRDGVDYANGYLEGSVPPAADQVDWAAAGLWISHLETLLGTAEAAELVVKWMAHNVQYPGQKIRWAPVVVGIPGSGKSLIGNLLTAVMGERNVKVIGTSALTSDFNSWAHGACVGILEEIKASGHRRAEIMDKLKEPISNNTVDVHGKNLAAINVPNTQNYLAFTNHDDALYLDDTDRRWAVLHDVYQHADELPGRAYYDALVDSIKTSAAGLRRWLLEIDLTGFVADGRAPIVMSGKGDGKAHMIAESFSDEDAHLADLIEKGGHGFNNKVISIRHLNAAARRAGAEVPYRTRLKHLGWTQFDGGKQVKWGGEVTRVWVKRGCNFSQAEVRAELDKTEGDAAQDFS